MASVRTIAHQIDLGLWNYAAFRRDSEYKFAE